MCFAYDGLSHTGSGRGRWYDARISSAVGPLEDAAAPRTPAWSSILPIVPIVWASEGDVGSGGSFVARLDDEWLGGRADEDDEPATLMLPAEDDDARWSTDDVAVPMGRPLADDDDGMPEVGVRGWLEVDDVGLLLLELDFAVAPRKRAFLDC